MSEFNNSNFNNSNIETLIREVVQSVLHQENNKTQQKSNQIQTAQPVQGNQVSVADYPLGKKKPEVIKTPAGNTLNEITLQKVTEGQIKSADVRITPETLNLQAQIAEQVNRPQFAQNLKRAAELTAIPDERVLEIYNALRPYRSTKAELMAIAGELESRYNAKINAAMVRQAAEVYEKRNRLRK